MYSGHNAEPGSKYDVNVEKSHIDNQQIGDQYNLIVNILSSSTHSESAEHQLEENNEGKLVDYLKEVKDRIYSPGVDNKRLSDYFQKQRVEIVNITMKQVSKPDNEDIITIIEKFLHERHNEWYLIVGASFGMGKTAMAKWVASKYAEKYLSDRLEDRINDYVPILVNLQYGLSSVYGQEPLETVLKIVAPRLDRRILLILDGLDEYKDGTQRSDVEKIRDLKVKLLDVLHDKYKQNLKVIITTRLRSDILNHRDLNINKYVKILEFSKNQVDNFFNQYGVHLTYEDAKRNFGLHHDEICKPLFAWMLSLMNTESVIHVQFNSNWTMEMRMTLIYMLFFHYILRGKYKDTYNEEDWNQYYISEKETLRGIAALKQIYETRLSSITGGSLPTETPQLNFTVQNKITHLKSKIHNLPELEQILSCYCDLRSKVGLVGQSVSFLHGTMQEYLLAEYYIDSLLAGSTHKLNIGMPSERTIFFINGLIEILDAIKTSQNDPNEKFIINEGTSLIRSFVFENPNQWVGPPPDPHQEVRSILSNLANYAFESFNRRSIIFTDIFNVKKNTENIWTEADISGYDYIILWIHRWISLCILSKLAPDRINPEEVETLIRYSNNSIPAYLKCVRGATLNQMNLSRANLSEADLSYANLSDVNFSYSDLSKAKLHDISISGPASIASRINFSNANLTKADLSGARVPNADLSHADLSYANAESAVLPYADLSYTNLSNANLTGADLSNANLTGADLSYTNLSNANLTGADLSSSTILHCVGFGGLQCIDAVFSRSILNQKELREYLKTNLARDVPETDNK